MKRLNAGNVLINGKSFYELKYHCTAKDAKTKIPCDYIIIAQEKSYADARKFINRTCK